MKSWTKYPILELPEDIAYYLGESSEFMPYWKYGRKSYRFIDVGEWVAKRLIEGEIGSFMGYRIVVKEWNGK